VLAAKDAVVIAVLRGICGSIAAGLLAASLSGCVSRTVGAVPNGAQPSPAIDNPVRAAVRKESLLYLFDLRGRFTVLTYLGGQPVMSFFPPQGVINGLCTDTFGDVYATDDDYGTAGIFEYAYGSKTASEPYPDPDGEPWGCAKDPNSTYFAVANIHDAYGADGNIIIFRIPSEGPPIYHVNGMAEYLYCAYDNEGNLFLDGTDRAGNSLLAVLPKGAKTFTSVTLNRRIEKPGTLQWDGSYMTIEDRGANVIYRVRVLGPNGFVVGSTPLSAWRTHFAAQSFIYKDAIVVPDGRKVRKIGVWAYPAGGKPQEIIDAPHAGARLEGAAIVAPPKDAVHRSAPAPGTGSPDLVYVSNVGSDTVDAFAYPSLKYVGQLTGRFGFGSPRGLCADHHGHLYVVDTGREQVVQFAHGGTYWIAIVDDTYGSPLGCAVSPITDELAVTNYDNQSGAGNVLTFSIRTGAPHQFSSPKIYHYLFAAYDDAGNLYVDGEAKTSHRAQLAELPRNGSALKSISLDHAVENPGALVWSDRELVIGDQKSNEIYRFSVSGSSATLAGMAQLDRAKSVYQFGIANDRIVATDSVRDAIGLWSYPSGGEPLRRTTGNLDQAAGIVISSAPHR
jgi:hypothetical protein